MHQTTSQLNTPANRFLTAGANRATLVPPTSTTCIVGPNLNVYNAFPPRLFPTHPSQPPHASASHHRVPLSRMTQRRSSASEPHSTPYSVIAHHRAAPCSTRALPRSTHYITGLGRTTCRLPIELPTVPTVHVDVPAPVLHLVLWHDPAASH
jgi:hypothetical protein